MCAIKHGRSTRKNPIAPPQFITNTARVKNSMIVDGCFISGRIEHSILAANVQVKEGSVVKDSVVMTGASIGKKCNYQPCDHRGKMQLLVMVL